MRAKLAATEPIESRDELSGKVADMYILVNDMSGVLRIGGVKSFGDREDERWEDVIEDVER